MSPGTDADLCLTQHCDCLLLLLLLLIAASLPSFR